MNAASILWHDYETFGASPADDFPAQFAAIRTDHALHVLAEPISIYCQPPPDYLPAPIACLITGLTPAFCLQHGLKEVRFAALVHAELARANTTSAGYNSMRFDEEFTRQLLWRNAYPPFEREFKQGNARFDLIDVMRMAYALRPEGLRWPSVDGKPSFKLETLAHANGVSHTRAHDALSDVEALIELARRLREAQPKLWNYAFGLRRKEEIAKLIRYDQNEPLLHISQRFGAERGCLALWLPICAHPAHNNEIIGIDLSGDISDLSTLDAESISDRLFAKAADLPEGEQRILIKTLHLNRTPMVCALSLLRGVDLQRLQLHSGATAPLDLQLERARALRAQPELASKLRAVYARAKATPEVLAAKPTDLYQGFVPDADAALLTRLRAAEPSAYTQIAGQMRDQRLPELIWRLRARNFPETLDPSEQALWRKQSLDRLQFQGPMTFERFAAEIELARQHLLAEGQAEVLDQLQHYGQELRMRLR